MSTRKTETMPAAANSSSLGGKLQSAIGMRTSLKDLTVLGMRPVMLMLAETLFLAGIIALVMKLFVI